MRKGQAKMRELQEHVHASTDNLCHFCNTRPAIGDYTYKPGKTSIIGRLCTDCVLELNGKPTTATAKEGPCMILFVNKLFQEGSSNVTD